MAVTAAQRFAETMLFGEFTGLAGSQRDAAVQPEPALSAEVGAGDGDDDDDVAEMHQLQAQLQLEAEVPRWQPVWPAFDAYLHAWRTRQRHTASPTAAITGVRRLSSAAHDPLDASDDELDADAPPAAGAGGRPDADAPPVAPVVPAAGLELRFLWDDDAHTQALAQLLAQIRTSGGDANATDDAGSGSLAVAVQATTPAPGVLLPPRLYYYEVRRAGCALAKCLSAGILTRCAHENVPPRDGRGAP